MCLKSYIRKYKSSKKNQKNEQEFIKLFVKIEFRKRQIENKLLKNKLAKQAQNLEFEIKSNINDISKTSFECEDKDVIEKQIKLFLKLQNYF